MVTPKNSTENEGLSGTLYPPDRSTFLDDETIVTIQKEARKYRIIEKARSKKQFFFGRLANEIWVQIKDRPDIRGEIYKDDLYVEMSYWINEGQDFPLVGASGETLRRWAETAAQFENVPAVKELEEALSFDHFFRARKLYNAGLVEAPVYPLAIAVKEGLIAEEMTNRFTDPPEIEPEKLELRMQFPEWAWLAAYKLLSLNGEREQAEFHLREYIRIVSPEELLEEEK